MLRRLLAFATLWLPIAMLLAATAARTVDIPFVETMRLKGFDSYQQAAPRAYQPMPVYIVDIDDESLHRIGQWPWPRTVMAELVEAMQAAGAASIALDMVFSEPDRTSPSAMLQLWGRHVGDVTALKALGDLPDHDRRFAEAISKAPVVSGVVMTGSQTSDAKPALKAGFSHVGLDPAAMATPFDGSVINLPLLEGTAPGNGVLNAIVDRDGLIRRVPLLVSLKGQLYPSLSAESLRVAMGAGSYLVKTSEQGAITHVKLGDMQIPVDAHGHVWLRYSESTPTRYLPAWKLLENAKDLPDLEGSILFLGTSAAGLKDIRATPLNPVIPGVEVHVQAVEQMLLGEFLTRPDWMEGAEILSTLLLGLAMVVAIRLLGAVGSFILLGVVVGGIAVGGYMAYTRSGVLLDAVYPILTILSIHMVATVLRYLATEHEKSRIRGAFSHYMSPALVEELAKNPDRLSLGGEMRDMTILFCDVRGFTTISEQFDAVGLTGFMNRYLTPMTEVILNERGTIDKYIGDCIMAFWNAPLDDHDHARNACLAALKMAETCKMLDAAVRQEFIDQGKKPVPVAIGIGLNSGEVCVGNMGSTQRFDYSVLGDDVNLASRLEGQSKTYGVTTVIGDATKAAAGTMATLELDLIKVKGKTKPVRIHTLLGDEAMATDNSFIQLHNAWDGMLTHYRSQKWNDAEHWLHNASRMAEAMGLPLEGLFALYAERIAEFRAHKPGKDWDGVFVAKSK